MLLVLYFVFASFIKPSFYSWFKFSFFGCFSFVWELLFLVFRLLVFVFLSRHEAQG